MEQTSAQFDPFATWAPLDLIKADDGLDGARARIHGIISTEARDFQGEEIAQDGIDWSYFIKSGWFNWEHKPGPEHIIGEPERVERVEVEGKPAPRVVGVLVLDTPLARGIFDTMRALHKARSSRRIGLSVEGRVLAREGKRILKAQVLNTAICAHPINPEARVELLKGLAAQAGYQTPASAAGGASLSPLIPASQSQTLSSETISFERFKRMCSETFGPQHDDAIARTLWGLCARTI